MLRENEGRFIYFPDICPVVKKYWSHYKNLEVIEVIGSQEMVETLTYPQMVPSL